MALLKLPPEIRQKIYQELLVFAPYKKALPQSTGHRSTSPQARRPQGVQILRVCKTIYYEAVHILYSENIFKAWTHDEVDLLRSHIYGLYKKLILDGGKSYTIWEKYSSDVVSRLFDVNTETLPNPQSRLLNLARDSQFPLNLIAVGLLESLCPFHRNKCSYCDIYSSTEMLTAKFKEKPNAQQPGIERRTAMSSFPTFLCSIGPHNAKKIRAIQLPVFALFPKLFVQLFGEIVCQHIPDMAHLVVDWDAARCYRDIWDLPAESSLDRYSHWSAIRAFVQFRLLSNTVPSLERLTFVEGLPEFNEMGRITLDKENHHIADLEAIWTSIVERPRKSRRNLGRPCVCRHEVCSW